MTIIHLKDIVERLNKSLDNKPGNQDFPSGNKKNDSETVQGELNFNLLSQGFKIPEPINCW
jgi:hypothetical protein